MKNLFNEKYFLEVFKKLLDIDSTTGLFEEIDKEVLELLKEYNLDNIKTHKGGIITALNEGENPLVVTAHLDTIGLMVRHINNDGTLKVCPIGGLNAFYSVLENVRVHTRDGKVYSGTICRKPNSVHVTEDELRKTLSDYNTNVCIVLDEDVKSKEDTIKLGIEVGDFIALDTRLELVNGFIKSRFIDDKVAVAILFVALKAIKENNLKLNRKVYFYFADYEEIGHGTSFIPSDVKDILAIDIAPLGDEQTSDEHKVSIFAKDSRFPYNDQMTNEIRRVALDNNINYVMDVFTPHYGTDCDTSIVAGYDIRHAAIGFGTANSHGYERCHMDGVKETFYLLLAYLTK